MGLSRYKVETVGASKPVSHLEQRKTSRNLSDGFRNRSSIVSCSSPHVLFIISRCARMSKTNFLEIAFLIILKADYHAHLSVAHLFPFVPQSGSLRQTDRKPIEFTSKA